MTRSHLRATLSLAAAVCASLGLLLGGASCARQPPRPPILLITLGGLRADMVGGLGGEQGLTPNLDRLIAASSWAGRAISTASTNAPAAASVLTGLRPWQHQLLAPGGVLAKRYFTLPQILRRRGYKSHAFTTGPYLRRANGVARGFDRFKTDAGPDAARAALAALTGEADPAFLWVDVDLVGAGYRREDRFLSRLANAPQDLPAAVSPVEIESFFDPAVAMPAEVKARFLALYRTDVARADEQIGALVEVFRAAGRFDEALIVVVSEHGEEFGEYEQAGHGGSLGRNLIEVPMVIKLPRPPGAVASVRLAVPEEERVSIARVFATVLAAATIEAPPGVAPSLNLRDSRGALSELYVGNGVNTTSLVRGNLQLLRSVRFAPAEPDYFRARLARLDSSAPATAEPAKRMLAGMSRTFRRHLPFSGNASAVTLQLRRWLPDGSSEVVQDSADEQDMASELERCFFAFLPQELTAGQALHRR